ncbi:hypothetical protein CF326_g2108 [Tilletia indica]|nr:hypothetical protein CF326_g2108 [Tilletia indica]
MASDAVVLTDELYADILSKIDRSYQSMVWHCYGNEEPEDIIPCGGKMAMFTTAKFLIPTVQRAFEASKKSIGSSQASVRRGKVGAFFDKERFEQDIGLGTLACQVLVSSSTERQRIRQGRTGKETSSISLSQSWRKIPVHLRHITLPLQAALAAFVVIRNIWSGDSLHDASCRLAKSMSVHFMDFGSIFQAEIFADLLMSFCPRMPLSGFFSKAKKGLGLVPVHEYLRQHSAPLQTQEPLPRIEPIIILSFPDPICARLESCSTPQELGTTLQPFLSSTLAVLWRDITPWIPHLIESCLRAADRLISTSTTSDVPDIPLCGKDLDLQMALVLGECEGPISHPEKSHCLLDKRSSLPPGFKLDPNWTSDTMRRTLHCFAKSSARTALPRATTALVTLLVKLLFTSRLEQLREAAPAEYKRVFKDEYCCYHSMTNATREHYCRKEATLSAQQVERLYLREALSSLEPSDTCKYFAEVLHAFYGTPDESADHMPAGDDDEAERSGHSNQKLLDANSLWAGEPAGQTAILLHCIVTLCELGLHRAEAELAASMLSVWNLQTACDPVFLDHPDRAPLDHPDDAPPIVDLEEENDCEDIKKRRERRDAVSNLIAKRVALAEEKAVAQEQAWAVARAERQAGLDSAGGTERTTHKVAASGWRWEPLLDSWVAAARSDVPDRSDEERSQGGARPVTPRASSVDPLDRTSPFAAEEQSETESLKSNLRLKGESSNPYAQEVQVVNGQQQHKRSQHSPDDDDDQDDMDLFNRRTPMAKRKRRPPQRYDPHEEDLRSKGKGKARA